LVLVLALETLVGPKVGVATPPPQKGKASSGSHRPSSPDHLTGTTISLSPSLVHFSDYTALTSCHLLETDLGIHKDLWRFSLIGYIAGKFPGYTSLSKFINSSWKCDAKFSMHDSRWLIFTFSSEMDMIEVLSGGPYYVFGRPLILKIMLEFFYFTTSEMVRMLVWVKFPNLPLQCWSLICLSKLASVLGKPVHFDSPTASMTRLSYARLLVEIDLLADLPTSINLILPNSVPLSQQVMYESLPRFCKQCRTLGHTISTCTKTSNHKCKKHSQTAPSLSGCSSPSAKTTSVEK